MPTPAFSLVGKRALVTGATSGLGYEIARLFALQGAHVFVNGRSTESCEKAVQAIGGEASPLPFDATGPEAIADAMALFAPGGLDILVNNVGLRDRRALAEFSAADVARLVNADLVAPFLLAQQAAGLMVEGGTKGRILNISSIAGIIAQSGDAAYTSAKAGINGMTKALAAELGPHGITVNAIAPGFFRTAPNAAAAQDPAVSARLEAATALKRWGEPAELAPAALFLASDEASYVTGQVLAVDGGYTSHY